MKTLFYEGSGEDSRSFYNQPRVLYMRIFTQNIACSQSQMHTCIHHCYTSERESEKQRQTDRDKDRAGEREPLNWSLLYYNASFCCTIFGDFGEQHVRFYTNCYFSTCSIFFVNASQQRAAGRLAGVLSAVCTDSGIITICKFKHVHSRHCYAGWPFSCAMSLDSLKRPSLRKCRP